MNTTTRRTLAAVASATIGAAAVAIAPTAALATADPSADQNAKDQKAVLAQIAAARAEVGSAARGRAGQAGVSAAAAIPLCTSWRDFSSGDTVMHVPSATLNGDLDCELFADTFDNGAVVKLQDALILCYGQGIARDGDFGAQTAGAVMNVERFHGFDPIGLYDVFLGSAMFFPFKSISTGQWQGRCA